MFYRLNQQTLKSRKARNKEENGESSLLHTPSTATEISVIIPAYNEEHTIDGVISQTITTMNSTNLPYEIIVVDDGSDDRTGELAARHNVKLLSNLENKGKGYCLKRALEYAKGGIIVTIDSDGEHKPKEIPDLLEPIFTGADIVSGSRFLNNKGYVTTNLHRIGNQFFNITIMSLTGKWITDSQTGFRAIRRSVLDRLKIESDGYEVETEIAVKSLKNDFIFEERPVSIIKRQYSISKIRLLSDGTKILKTIVKATTARIRQ
jgi:glycosyltransferase involved in cell wall biosynthesis